MQENTNNEHGQSQEETIKTRITNKYYSVYVDTWHGISITQNLTSLMMICTILCTLELLQMKKDALTKAAKVAGQTN